MSLHSFRNGPRINWATRWLGGMCPAGVIGGLPVRGPDYAAHPQLADLLTLPVGYPCPVVELEEVVQNWRESLSASDDPILLLANSDRARALLLQAAGVAQGEAVAVPANGDLPLVESVKRHGAVPTFFALDTFLNLVSAPTAQARWVQPPAGLPPGPLPDPNTWWLDWSHTCPLPKDLAGDRPSVAVTLYGLHLYQTGNQTGALLHFQGEWGHHLYHQMLDLLTPLDQPDPARAAAQLQRLTAPGGLATRQWDAVNETALGLQEAAGLPLLPITAAGGLPHVLAVQMPPEIEPATFFAYVQAENTPVQRLSEMRPIHYAALREDGYSDAIATAKHLARWLLVPVGPDYTDEEIKHGILGIVKAADYLGVRWYTDPAQATDYAAMLTDVYGPGHDAYRPIFATEN